MFVILNSRLENRDYLDAALSETSKRNRTRRNTISLSLGFLSWFLEFITGSFLMIDYVIHVINNEGGSNILILLDIFLCAVLVPSTYIFKTEAFKEALFNDGCLQVATNLFQSVFKFLPIEGISCCKARVDPAEEIEMPQLPQLPSSFNDGWLQVARNLFQSIFKCLPIDGISCCKAKVNPAEEIEMPQLPHDNSIQNEVSAPISTISGKIENDIHIGDL